MDNLIFSLNVTVPIFALMLLGYFFNKIGFIDDIFAAKLNTFVFRIPLPLLVFKDLAVVDIAEAWNGRYILFCFVVTLLSIAGVALLSLLIKDKSMRGEFIQCSYRSSAALLGIAFISSIYGDSGMGPMMIIGSVPLYNVVAVLVLSLTRPDMKGLNKETLKKTFLGILKNPIIWGIAIGLLWSALKLPLTGIPEKVVGNIAATATPLGLMAMGATFSLKKAFGVKKVAISAVAIKLVGLAALFMPLAVALGYRASYLVAILVMLCSPTTVSSYVMAKNMGHDGVVSSAVVMLTTLLSAFTLTFWLWLIKSMGLL
ncbi:MAG: AEC family transporter [Lachnospiraceae bacterium]|nr:AEC family transporter [Lachnospiraceae bacterium]